MKQAMLAGAVMGLAQVAYVSINAPWSSNIRSNSPVGRYSPRQTHQSAQGKFSRRDFSFIHKNSHFKICWKIVCDRIYFSVLTLWP